MIDPIRIRRDFPIFEMRNDEKPLIYLDNAASTQKPRQVIEAITDFYSTSYANIHRSPHRLGAEATEQFETVRAKVARFIGSADTDEVIFTKGTTESINLVAGILAQQYLQPDDVILLTPSEHHSNLIPWQMAANLSGAKLQFVTLHKGGQLNPDEIERNWDPRVKVFAFQHASNVLGSIHPVKELCRIAGNNGALTMIDAAQAVPHMPVNVQELGCDFYAFSSHKMCGPTGIGALWGRRELLERFDPIFGGGEMIGKVDLYSCTYNVIPYKFEPGTPNIVGAIGFGAAIDYLQQIGMSEVRRYTEGLAEYAIDRLSQVEGLTVYGPHSGRTGAVSFWMDGIHPHDLATVLDINNIAIRAGHHCAAPLMQWLDVPATARASFYIYNSRDEVDMLAAIIKEAKKVMNYAD